MSDEVFSGLFNIVIYVSTNILELRKHWCIDAVSPDTSLKGLTSWFCQSLLQILKQQVQIGWGQPEVHKSHTSTSTTQGETSLDSMVQKKMDTIFWLLYTLLQAASKSAVSYLWKQQTAHRQVKPHVTNMQETSLQQPFKHRSLLQRFLWVSHVWLIPCNTFPFPPNADWDFSWSCKILFYLKSFLEELDFPRIVGSCAPNCCTRKCFNYLLSLNFLMFIHNNFRSQPATYIPSGNQPSS